MRLQPLNRFGRWGVFQQPVTQQLWLLHESPRDSRRLFGLSQATTSVF